MSIWATPITFGVTLVVGLVWWFLLVCLVLRGWDSDDNRELREKESRLLSEEIQYHNRQIYRDFEFYVKITLAIVAGVAYVLCRECPGFANAGTVGRVLILAAGGLEALAGILLAHFIFFHQRSKLLRWKKKAKCADAWKWQETWLFASLMAASIAFGVALAPYLAGAV